MSITRALGMSRRFTPVVAVLLTACLAVFPVAPISASSNIRKPITTEVFQEQAAVPALSAARFVGNTFLPFCRHALIWTLVLAAAGLPQRVHAGGPLLIRGPAIEIFKSARKTLRYEGKVELLRKFVKHNPNAAAQSGAWKDLSELEAAEDPAQGLKRFREFLDHEKITPDKYSYAIVTTLVEHHYLAGELNEGAELLRKYRTYLESPSARENSEDKRRILDNLRRRLFDIYMKLGDYQAALEIAPDKGLKTSLEAFLLLPESQRPTFDGRCPGIFGCNGDFRGKGSPQTSIPVWVFVNPHPSKMISAPGRFGEFFRGKANMDREHYESLIKDISSALDYLSGDKHLKLKLRDVSFKRLHSLRGTIGNKLDIVTSEEVRPLILGEGFILIFEYGTIKRGEHVGHGVITVDAGDLEWKSKTLVVTHEMLHSLGMSMWHAPHPSSVYNQIDPSEKWLLDRAAAIDFENKTVKPHLGVTRPTSKQLGWIHQAPVPVGRYTTLQEDIAKVKRNVAKQSEQELKQESNNAAPASPLWIPSEINLRPLGRFQRNLATAS